MRLRNVAIAAVLTSACGGSAPKTSSADHHETAHHHHGNHHRFDDAARWSKVFDDPGRDAWQKPEKVIALMRLEPGMSVADIGAGTGYFEPHLARAVGEKGRVLAIDVEPNMVEWMSERASREGWKTVTPRLGAPDDPKIPDASVTRVLVVDVWHHIGDRPAYAKKIAQALAPNGAVFIVDFTKEAPHGPPAQLRLAPELIVGDLEGAGLVDVKIHLPAATGLPHQYVVEGKKAAAP